MHSKGFKVKGIQVLADFKTVSTEIVINVWSMLIMMTNGPQSSSSLCTNISKIFPKSSQKARILKGSPMFPPILLATVTNAMFSNVPTTIQIGRSKYQKNNINQSWCCFTICQIPNFVKDASLAKLCIFCSRPCTFARKGQLPNFHTKGGNLISAKETFNTISFEEKPSTLRGNKDVNSSGVYLKFRQDPAHKGELRRVTSFSQRQIFGNHLGIYFTTI